jgi:hypothetical protein
MPISPNNRSTRNHPERDRFMEMVGHQTKRMNLPGSLPTGLGKGLDKTLIILGP